MIVIAGVLLLLYGLVPIAWVIYSLVVTEAPVGEFLEQLVNPLSEGDHVRALTPYEWAFAVALIVVGICVLARRPAARGGALMLSLMLLFLSLREGIGLLDATYRDDYFHNDEGGWILATRIFGLIVAVVVLAAMAKATEDARSLRSNLLVTAGWAMLLAGVAKLAFIGAGVSEIGLDNYLSTLFDPSGTSPLSMRSQAIYYDAAITVALLVVGALAVLQRQVARGAGLTLMGVVTYVVGYQLVAIVGSSMFSIPIDSTVAFLFWASLVTPVAAAVIALPLLALAKDPGSDPPGPAPLLGDVGQEHASSH